MFTIPFCSAWLGEKRLSATVGLIVALAIAANSTFAQCPNFNAIQSAANAGRKPDNTFISSSGTNGYNENDARFTVPIDRVVGPGTPDEFDGSGFLRYWNTYVSNGVIADPAWLSVDVGLIDCCVEQGVLPTDLVVLVNGHSAGSKHFTMNVGGPYCIPVSTQYLKFAKRGSGPGSLAVPANNEIKIVLTHSWVDVDLASIAVQTLTVNAMYPVILITGCCGESSSFWNNPALPPASLESYFDSVKVPYDDRRSMPYGGILGGDIWQGAGTLNLQIPKIAKTFGVNWVHLVAHSKGGLNARALLARNWLQSSNIGVLSLTTLDTPHEGTMGADYFEQWLDDAQFIDLNPVQDSVVRRVIEAQRDSDRFLHTLEDLTQVSLGQFNFLNPTPPGQTRVGNDVRPLKAFALSSDADRDSNRLISPDEYSGMPVPVGSLGMQVVYTTMYNLMGNAQGLEIGAHRCVGSLGLQVNCVSRIQSVGGFRLNDLVVTTGSQSYLSNVGAFTPLANPSPAQGPIFGNNHNAVPNSMIAQQIFSNIKTITQSQP